MASKGEAEGTYIRKIVRKIDGVMQVVKVEIMKPKPLKKTPRQQRYAG